MPVIHDSICLIIFISNSWYVLFTSCYNLFILLGVYLFWSQDTVSGFIKLNSDSLRNRRAKRVQHSGSGALPQPSSLAFREGNHSPQPFDWQELAGTRKALTLWRVHVYVSEPRGLHVQIKYEVHSAAGTFRTFYYIPWCVSCSTQYNVRFAITVTSSWNTLVLISAVILCWILYIVSSI